MIVNEQQITKVLDQFESGALTPEDVLQEMRTAQPFLYGFVFSRPGVLLNADEGEILTFATSAIWKSSPNPEAVITGPDLEELEEIAWSRLEATKANTFRDKLDPFFEENDEEELLALVEDLLIDDEESHITAIGREWMFITLYVLIEAMINDQ